MLQSSRLSRLLAVALALSAHLASATSCFDPSGALETNDEYQPCSSDGSNPLHTICCAWNRDSKPDICAPNGLCQAGVEAGQPLGVPHYTKPQCKNSNWNEPGCLNVCGDKNLEWITPCDAKAGNSSTRWCCGFETTDCCNEDADLPVETLAVNFAEKANSAIPSTASASFPISPTSIPPTSISPTSISPTSISPTSISPSSKSQSSSSPSYPSAAEVSASPVSTTAPSPSAAPQDAGMSTGLKAGLAIGITLCALALLVLGIWLGRYLHNRKEARQARTWYKTQNAGAVAGAYVADASYYGAKAEEPAPSPSPDMKMELAAHNDPVELANTEVALKDRRGRAVEKDMYT